MSSRSREGIKWLLQAITGVILIFTVTLHIIRVHIYGSFKGLPTYGDVVFALRNPLMASLSIIFTLAVTYHALYGLKMVIDELSIIKNTELVNKILLIVGILINVYVIFIIIFVNLKI